jgi:CRP-like cAMP-binding protein
MDFCTGAGMRFVQAIFATQKSLERGLIACIRPLKLFNMSAQNRLLAVLPREVYEKLASNLKRVSLNRGTILHHPGETIKDLYLPALDHHHDE